MKVTISESDLVRLQEIMHNALSESGSQPPTRIVRKAFINACESIGISIVVKADK